MSRIARALERRGWVVERRPWVLRAMYPAPPPPPFVAWGHPSHSLTNPLVAVAERLESVPERAAALASCGARTLLVVRGRADDATWQVIVTTIGRCAPGTTLCVVTAEDLHRGIMRKVSRRPPLLR